MNINIKLDKNKKFVFLSILVILFILFVTLTYLVINGIILPYDVMISKFVYSFRTPVLTVVMKFISALSSIYADIFLFLLVVLLSFRKYKKELIIFSGILSSSAILNYLMKIYFKLPRPNISPLEILNDYTYPSGHAMNNLILYFILIFFLSYTLKSKKILRISLLLLILIWVALIGFSRIYLGSHFLSDIVGGYLAGLCLLGIASLCCCNLFRQKSST